jgi:hypothetical protein
MNLGLGSCSIVGIVNCLQEWMLGWLVGFFSRRRVGVVQVRLCRASSVLRSTMKHLVVVVEAGREG